METLNTTTAPSQGDVANPELFKTPKNQRACWEGMPDEILLAISGSVLRTVILDTRIPELSHFTVPDETALARLCLVNKRCNRIAAGWLYESLSGGIAPPRISLAMEAVGNVNPLLGQYVKHLCMSSKSDMPEDCDDVRESFCVQQEYDAPCLRVLGAAHKLKSLLISDGLNMEDRWARTLDDDPLIQMFEQAASCHKKRIIK